MSTNRLSAIGLLLSAPAIVLWGYLLVNSERAKSVHDLLGVPDGVAQAVEIVVLLVLPLATVVLGRIATRRAEGPNPTALERITFWLGLSLVILAILPALFRR